jgi:release factor glutamine methyltransferase
MRPSQVVRHAAGYLQGHGVESPLSTAEVLLANVLGTSRSAIYSREERLSPAEAKTFGRALCRRCNGQPLQHITGEQGFRRLMLTVRPGVFIPRPETEVLVDVALRAIAGIDAPVVIDVGTGGGAVALAVADEHRGARVWATDRSPEAVALARENADRLHLSVDVVEGDLLTGAPDALRGYVDLVVSNPPYVRDEEFAALPDDVRADPVAALVGGLDVVERLADEAASWLRPGGRLAIEIGETQGVEVRAALASRGYDEATVTPDLTGRDRVVVSRRP